MVDATAFKNLRLVGGFIIAEVEFTPESMADALGRAAVAQTRISGKELRLRIADNLSDEELSVTLYHEVLEAMAVGISQPPATVMDLTEGGFEAAAWQMHRSLGQATPENVNRMLQNYGFRGE